MHNFYGYVPRKVQAWQFSKFTEESQLFGIFATTECSISLSPAKRLRLRRITANEILLLPGGISKKV